MCNDDWIDIYFDVVVDFLLEGIFDYTLVFVILVGRLYKGNFFIVILMGGKIMKVF